MWKAKSLVAAGLAVLGNMVWWNAMANNNQLSNQKDNTQTELADVLANPQQDESTFQVDLSLSPSDQIPQKKYEWIYAGFDKNPESLDWEKIYDIDLADVPVEVLKYWMLKKMNEIRVEHGLKPLKYDKKLEKLAKNFADDNRDFNRRESSYPHADSKWRWVSQRFQDAWLLWPYIEVVTVDCIKRWYWENMGSISGHTINNLFEDWMNSSGHREAIISPYHNSVWFAINSENDLIVHEFGNVKANK